MKLRGKIVVWPANLDSTKTRKTGRKLARGYAVQSPKLEELHEASKRLALEAEPTTGKARPSSWWEKLGYMTINKKGNRTAILRSLAEEVKQIRRARAASEKDRK